MRREFEPLLERAQALEAAGFDGLLVPDHFLAGDLGISESWATLAALAARTERLRLGGAVMCNGFRHPCLTAQIAATVDRISGGRLELGLGAGWMTEEFRQTGLPFPSAGVRIEMLAEALAVVLPALSGETVDFEGEHYQVRGFALDPTPVQTPRPPLHIGGGGDRLLRLAARHADVVSLVPPTRDGALSREDVVAFTAERMTERIGFLRSEAEKLGRDPASIEVLDFVSVVHIAENETRAAEATESMAELFGGTAEQVRSHPSTLVGTPEGIAALVAERRERWGIDSLMLVVRDLDAVEKVGRELLPVLRA